jgi:hypothetical protein
MQEKRPESKVYIIVLNWNQYALTAACIRSLLCLNYRRYHVLVVDNDSSDGSVDRLKTDFGTRIELIVNERNLGFTGGNNAGIHYALAQGAEYIMLLNNDTIVAADFLDSLTAVLQSHPQVGFVAPKIYLLEDNQRIWAAGGNVRMWLGLVGNRGRGQSDTGQFEQLTEVDFVSGCCLLTRREVLEQIGLLNDAYFAYYEDVDWCFRARAQGYQILYVPQSIIWHAVGSSSKGQRSQKGTLSPFVHYLVARNHLWLLRQHASKVQCLTAIPAYFCHRLIYYSAAFICLRRWHKLKSLWQGFWDGIMTSPC